MFENSVQRLVAATPSFVLGAALLPLAAVAQLPDSNPDPACGTPVSDAASGVSEDASDALLAEVWRRVASDFFDPDLNGVDWPAAFERHCPAFARATSREARAETVNAMLDELSTSHTRLYTPDEPAYYHLLGVFLPVDPDLAAEIGAPLTEGRPLYVGIGIETETVDGRVHVRDVLHGGPGAEAGLLRGDEIVLVDGAPFHPIRSFAGRDGQPVPMQVRRAEGAEPIEIVVTPQVLDGSDLFLNAMEASVAIEEEGALRIGYVRVWSYAGMQYQQLLEGELLYGRLKDADALVLDLRGGWGGASPTYLNLFRDQAVTLSTSDREGAERRFASAWDRPVVLLVDETSRSGKEIMVHGFQALGIGPVVGARTAGAVVGGRLMPLAGDDVLYLAVEDVHVDGRRLEGVGVAPDHPVPAPLPYAAGADPQREAALGLAAKAAEQP